MEWDCKSMLPEELKNLVAELGEKPFRAGQLFSWMHEKNVGSYEEMTNLSAAFREKLAEKYPNGHTGMCADAGVKTGRHEKISLSVIRWQCC